MKGKTISKVELIRIIDMIMESLGNIIEGLAFVCQSVLTIYIYIIIASAIISWVNADRSNIIVIIITRITEPAYDLVRKYLPFVYFKGFDFSPIFILLITQFLQYALVKNLFVLADNLKFM